MQPSPSASALRLATVAVLAVPWLPFVTVGRQPYRASEFASRIGELDDLTLIDASWGRPAQLALVAAGLALVATAAWGVVQRVSAFAAGTVGLVAATHGYVLAARSDLLSASPGLAVLLCASAVAVIVTTADVGMQIRSRQADRQPVAESRL